MHVPDLFKEQVHNCLMDFAQLYLGPVELDETVKASPPPTQQRAARAWVG